MGRLARELPAMSPASTVRLAINFSPTPLVLEPTPHNPRCQILFLSYPYQHPGHSSPEISQYRHRWRNILAGPHIPIIMIQIFDRRGFTLLLSVDAETLKGAQLAGAQLNDANLIQMDLHNIDLSGASLRDADLRLAKFDNANLANADLNGADLTKARLVGADLRGAKLLGAKLTGADLRGATVERKALMTADSSAAKLDEANIV